ncbi:MAG: DUF4157 domain-containing protein, partial [Acidimicrobiales bacterium]
MPSSEFARQRSEVARRSKAKPAPSAKAAGEPTRHPLLDLPQRIGNRATSELLDAQAALEVGSAHDPHEREADAIAEQVVEVLRGGLPAPPTTIDEPAPGLARLIRRRSSSGGRGIGPEGGTVDGEAEAALAAQRGRGASLHPEVRRDMEHAFGSDFSQVRVHGGPASKELSEQLGARAFTIGSDIYFRGGVPDSSNPVGQRLLGHELAHVVQQGASVVGRVIQRTDDSSDDEGTTTTTTHTGLGKKMPEEVKTGKDRRKESLKKGEELHYARPRSEGFAYGLWRFENGEKFLDAGFDSDPLKTSEIIGSKFPKGPGLTGLQYELIDEFSKTEHGERWLDEAGMFTVQRAEEYLSAHKFQAWLRLDAANRILLAYIAWRRRDEIGLDVVEGTPPYNLGRSMDGKDSSFSDRRRKKYQKQIDSDIRDEWVKTLKQPDEGQLDMAKK